MVIEIRTHKYHYGRVKAICTHLGLIYSIRPAALSNNSDTKDNNKLTVAIQEASDLIELLYELNTMGTFKLIKKENYKYPVKFILKNIKETK